MTTRQRVEGASLEGMVETAKGLAHPTRIRLLAMLRSGELCVCQLTAVLGLAPSTVSQHLSVLSRGSLVRERKDGKLVFYRLREDGPATATLKACLDSLNADPTVGADAKVVSRLRRVPVVDLCAAELDLTAVGIHPPTGAPRPSS